MTKLIMIAFSFIFVIGVIKKPRSFFRLGYITLLAIPIGSTNIILDYTSIFDLGNASLNVIHVIIITLFVRSIYDFVVHSDKNGRLVAFKELLLLVFFCILVITAVIMSFYKNNPFVSDGQKFIMFAMWIFITYVHLKYMRHTYKSFCYDTFFGLSINFTAIILMNVFYSNFSFLIIQDVSTVSRETGFVSYAANIAYFPILMLTHNILSNDIKKEGFKLTFYASLVALITNVIFASNRTFLVILFAAIIVQIAMSKQFRSLNFKLKCMIMATCFIVLILSVGILYYFENPLILRLLSTNPFTLDDNLVTRINTVLYYTPSIVRAPFGHGFGIPLPLINIYWRIHGNSLFTDNSFINIGMKIGGLGVILAIITIAKAYYGSFKVYKQSGNVFYISIMIIFSSILFACGIFTGQILNNYPVTFFFASLLIMMMESDKSSVVDKVESESFS